MELSCARNGVATGTPSGPAVERGAQVVGALVVGRQVAAEHGRFERGCDSRCGRRAARISGTRNSTAQT